jgi:hypothetical protein
MCLQGGRPKYSRGRENIKKNDEIEEFGNDKRKTARLG